MRLFIAVNFPDDVIAELMKTVNGIGEQLRAAQLPVPRLTIPQNLHLTLAFIGETNRVKEISAAVDDTAAKFLDSKPPVFLKLGSDGNHEKAPASNYFPHVSTSKKALPYGFGMFGSVLYLSAYGCRAENPEPEKNSPDAKTEFLSESSFASESSVASESSFAACQKKRFTPDPVCVYANALADSLRALGFDIERRPFRAHITLAREFDGATFEKLSLKAPEKTVEVKRISLMKSERIDGRMKYTEIFGREIAYV